MAAETTARRLPPQEVGPVALSGSTLRKPFIKISPITGRADATTAPPNITTLKTISATNLQLGCVSFQMSRDLLPTSGACVLPKPAQECRIT